MNLGREEALEIILAELRDIGLSDRDVDARAARLATKLFPDQSAPTLLPTFNVAEAVRIVQEVSTHKVQRTEGVTKIC